MAAREPRSTSCRSPSSPAQARSAFHRRGTNRKRPATPESTQAVASKRAQTLVPGPHRRILLAGRGRLREPRAARNLASSRRTRRGAQSGGRCTADARVHAAALRLVEAPAAARSTFVGFDVAGSRTDPACRTAARARLSSSRGRVRLACPSPAEPLPGAISGTMDGRLIAFAVRGGSFNSARLRIAPRGQ